MHIQETGSLEVIIAKIPTAWPARVDVSLLPAQDCLSSKSLWISANLMQQSFSHSSWSLDKCAPAYWGFQKERLNELWMEYK